MDLLFNFLKFCLFLAHSFRKDDLGMAFWVICVKVAWGIFAGRAKRPGWWAGHRLKEWKRKKINVYAFGCCSGIIYEAGWPAWGSSHSFHTVKHIKGGRSEQWAQLPSLQLASWPQAPRGVRGRKLGWWCVDGCINLLPSWSEKIPSNPIILLYPCIF